MDLNTTFINSSKVLSNNVTYLQYQSFHENFYSATLSKTAYAFILFMTHVIGPILLSGIIIFEKKGGDPQKRNIINRLLSLALTNQIIYTTLVGTSKICREIFGLISFETMIWVEFLGYIALNNVLLFLNEMTIMKYLNIIVWKRVKGLNDSFWESVMCSVTLAWSSWQCVCDHMPLEMRLYSFKVSTESFPKAISHYRYI